MKKKRYDIRLFLIPVAIVVLLAGVYFAQRSGSNANQYGNDFNVYYFAAREVTAGRTPYDNSLGEWTPYLYPPLFAELLIPIALLPLPVAAYLWFLINAASTFAALWWASSLVAGDTKNASPRAPVGFEQWMIIALTLLLLLRFVLDNFDYGQVNLLVAALCVGHFTFYAKKKTFISALALAFAASIKLTPVLFLAYHLVKGRWRFTVMCGALLIALTGISFLPFGNRADDAFLAFFNRTIRNEQKFDLAYHGNQSLRGAVERLGGNAQVTNPSDAKTAGLALLIFIAAVVVAARTDKEVAAVSAFFCLTVFLSPLSWKQHFVILVLPVALLVAESLSAFREKKGRWLVAIAFIVFALFNLTSPKLIGVAGAEWCDAHSFIFLGALLLTFVSLYFSTIRRSPLTAVKS